MRQLVRLLAAQEMVPDRQVLVAREELPAPPGGDAILPPRGVHEQPAADLASVGERDRAAGAVAACVVALHGHAVRDLAARRGRVFQQDVVELRAVDVHRPAMDAVLLPVEMVEEGDAGLRLVPGVDAPELLHPAGARQHLGQRARLLQDGNERVHQRLADVLAREIGLVDDQHVQ
jgi:hypothetical protein